MNMSYNLLLFIYHSYANRRPGGKLKELMCADNLLLFINKLMCANNLLLFLNKRQKTKPMNV